MIVLLRTKYLAIKDELGELLAVNPVESIDH